MTGIARIAVLASGGGTNLQAVLDACAGGALPAQVVGVFSDRSDAGALARARAAHVATVRHVSRTPGAPRHEYDRALADAVASVAPDWIVLAGFMRILHGPLLHAFPRRIVNIHPSLLPKYPGKNAIPAALQSGDTTAGCTVHYVDGGIDTGEIIAQSTVPVKLDETQESLTRKIQWAEHALLPATLQRLLHQV